MRMSGVGCAHGNCTGTKAGAWATQLATASNRPPPLPLATCSALMTQRRARFALTSLARATAAIDTPGCPQAATTCALNSAL